MNSRQMTGAGLALVSGSLIAALLLMLQAPSASGRGRVKQESVPVAQAISSATAAHPAPVTEPVLTTVTWPTGIRQAEGLIGSSGLKQGVWRMWHENGQLRFEGAYVDGRLDTSRPWREYNADGSIRFDSEDGPPPDALLSSVPVVSEVQF